MIISYAIFLFTWLVYVLRTETMTLVTVAHSISNQSRGLIVQVSHSWHFKNLLPLHKELLVIIPLCTSFLYFRTDISYIVQSNWTLADRKSRVLTWWVLLELHHWIHQSKPFDRIFYAFLLGKRKRLFKPIYFFISQKKFVRFWMESLSHSNYGIFK